MFDVLLSLPEPIVQKIRELSALTGKGPSDVVAQAIENDAFLREAIRQHGKVVAQSAKTPAGVAEVDKTATPVVSLP